MTKAVIHRQITTVTTSVVTTKVTTKDIEKTSVDFDSENDLYSDEREDSLYPWEKAQQEQIDGDDSDE
jgi:hypothetical protein